MTNSINRFCGAIIPLIAVQFVAFLSGVAQANPPPAGVAPINPPAGGFGIDGNIVADSPTVNVGDWVAGTNSPPGAGGAVLSMAGVPLNAATTFHFIDAYNGNDLVFVGGLKWTDNPKNWKWTTGKCSSKTDINNVLLHTATD